MIKIGDSATRSRKIEPEDVEAFARITGDTNPVHLDEAYARTTRFGRRIAHGILVSGLISAILANDLPGPGTVYIHQELNFKSPVFIGDEIKAVVTCVDIREDKPIAKLDTKIWNAAGELVIDGEAVVLVATPKGTSE
ncbi:MAG: MaoC family dehydratase [Bacteroidetes bacterium]|nr:MaoC family dehydratase [Bacteroidota bacterium]